MTENSDDSDDSSEEEVPQETEINDGEKIVGVYGLTEGSKMKHFTQLSFIVMNFNEVLASVDKEQKNIEELEEIVS